MLSSLIQFDESISRLVYGGRVLPGIWEGLLYSLASVFIYALPVLLIILFFRSYRDRLNAIKITIGVVLAWQVISKYLGAFLYDHYGFRTRPFAGYGVKEFLFEQPDKAFPSDHSAVVMVVALSLFAYKYPKLGWFFLIGGVLSTLGRVVIGFHYMGDVLGSWAIGAIVAGALILIDQYLDSFLKKIPLLNKWLLVKRDA